MNQPKAARTIGVCRQFSMSPEPSRLHSILEAYDGADASSQDVLDHFGPDAPALLNRYCCCLEDLLMNQQTRIEALTEKLAALEQENRALRCSQPEAK
ncbi:MAG: hypothetical protein VKN15_03290 [Cyanobacteriota bacterium]|nr:hypothetical protein [Cyanobacteriota bacterium]